jgi:pimeloyl-ACP methyl ester carboxylesterase
MRKIVTGLVVLVALLAGALWSVSQPDVPRRVLEAKYATAPSQFVMLPDGARAHVRDRGPRDGQALVLIHGSNASLFTWEPWAKRLSDTFRIITVDVPGHGLTGAVPNQDYSQEGMAKFVGEVADALHLERFALGGNSLGGRVAALFAARQPARLTHLILVDAGGIPSKQPETTSLAFRIARTPILSRLLLYITPRSLVVKGLNDAFTHKDIITDGMVDSYWDFVRMEGTRSATIIRLSTRDKGIREQIAKITAPTLILWGEDDHVIPIDVAHEFHAGIPRSKLIVYPETGHVPQEEVPDKSAADVRAFLTGDSAANSGSTSARGR